MYDTTERALELALQHHRGEGVEPGRVLTTAKEFAGFLGAQCVAPERFVEWLNDDPELWQIVAAAFRETPAEREDVFYDKAAARALTAIREHFNATT